MRPVTPFLTFAAVAVISAGCSSGAGSNSPVPMAPQSYVAQRGVAPDQSPCTNSHGCKPQLIVPLNFDGTTFTIATFRDCNHVNPSKAPIYTATSSGPLTLAGNVTLAPTCVPTTIPTSQLYIVGELTHRHGGGGGNGASNSKQVFTSIAGPVNWTDNPWSFAPLAPGLTLQSGSNYIFFVESIPPSPSPSPSPTAKPTDTPSPNPSPSASPTAEPTDTPNPSPSPSETPGN